MSMNVSFDGGRTWVSENDMARVDREIEKMNERKKKKATKESSAARVSKLKKQRGR